MVVNSAGTGTAKPVHAYTDKEWHRLIDVNLSGTFYVMRAAIPILLGCSRAIAGPESVLSGPQSVPAMSGSGAASILNVASLTGTRPTRVHHRAEHPIDGGSVLPSLQ